MSKNANVARLKDAVTYLDQMASLAPLSRLEHVKIQTAAAELQSYFKAVEAEAVTPATVPDLAPQP